MLTVAPYLRTRRPSPTTIEYIVSTSPPLTLPLRLLILLTHLLRITTGLCVLLTLYAKYHLSIYEPPFSEHTGEPPPLILSYAYLNYLLTWLLTTPLGTLPLTLASQTQFLLLAPSSSLILYLILRRRHTTESLLVLRGLGIQTSTSSETYLSSATTRFIPTDRIQDIFVNEAFRGFEVRYLLVVVVEGEDDLVVVFPRLLPGRRVVETVWRGARSCLGLGEAWGKEKDRDREKERRDSAGRG